MNGQLPDTNAMTADDVPVGLLVSAYTLCRYIRAVGAKVPQPLRIEAAGLEQRLDDFMAERIAIGRANIAGRE